MLQLKAEDGHEWTKRPVRVILVIRWNIQAVGPAEVLKFSRGMNDFTAILVTTTSIYP